MDCFTNILEKVLKPMSSNQRQLLCGNEKTSNEITLYQVRPIFLNMNNRIWSTAVCNIS